MKTNIAMEKSFAFSVRIVKLNRYIVQEKREYIMSRQLCKSGTSIGANIAEAQRGQSKADFAAKMNIALKEASETEYWLRLLHETNYLSDNGFHSLNKDLVEIIKILSAICKKMPQKI